MQSTTPALPFAEALFQPGDRVGIAVSGGADSVALLRTLLRRAEALGLVLSIVHVNHQLRGAEANEDQHFVEALASNFGLPCTVHTVDTRQAAASARQTLEEAARHLRYSFFADWMKAGHGDCIATAHTLNDQAETVLLKLLRGAWTEGLGGIYPVVREGATATLPGTLPAPSSAVSGRIVRPLLEARRADIEAYLHALHQPWREDSTNQDPAYTRNRVRHQLLPLLASYNPQIDTQLSRMAAIARDEEAWWQAEIERIGRTLLLPGKPVRGGGRASSTHPDERSIAFEVDRLRSLHPAVRRRVLRWAAAQVRFAAGFDDTERLMRLVEGGPGPSSRRIDLDGAVFVQRTARELQLVRRAPAPSARPKTALHVDLPIPGAIVVEAWNVQLATMIDPPGTLPSPIPSATVRPGRPGDRLTLRHSSGPKKLKDLIERRRIPAEHPEALLLVLWQDRVLWAGSGVELDPASLAGLPFRLLAAPIR